MELGPVLLRERDSERLLFRNLCVNLVFWMQRKVRVSFLSALFMRVGNEKHWLGWKMLPRPSR
jgi:hypothetical protein